MSQKQIQLIRLIYGCLTSLLLITVGICLIVSCISIYQSGDRPFSRESVAEAFGKIDILIYITVGIVIVGWLGEIFFKSEPSKPMRGKIAHQATLFHLYSRFDTKKASTETNFQLDKIQRMRLIAKITATVLYIACAVPVLVYFFTPGNFTMENLNGDIFAAIRFLCIFSVIALAVGLIYSFFADWTYATEVALIKREMANGAFRREGIEKGRQKEADGNSRGRLITRIVIAVLAVVFIFAGIFNGGMADVLAKAVRICTECIGLG